MRNWCSSICQSLRPRQAIEQRRGRNRRIGRHRRTVADLRQDRREPALDAAVQRVVVAALVMRLVRLARRSPRAAARAEHREAAASGSGRHPPCRCPAPDRPSLPRTRANPSSAPARQQRRAHLVGVHEREPRLADRLSQRLEIAHAPAPSRRFQATVRGRAAPAGLRAGVGCASAAVRGGRQRDGDAAHRVVEPDAKLLEPLLHAAVEFALHGPPAGIGADHLADDRRLRAVHLVHAPELQIAQHLAGEIRLGAHAGDDLLQHRRHAVGVFVVIDGDADRRVAQAAVHVGHRGHRAERDDVHRSVAGAQPDGAHRQRPPPCRTGRRR